MGLHERIKIRHSHLVVISIFKKKYVWCTGEDFYIHGDDRSAMFYISRKRS